MRVLLLFLTLILSAATSAQTYNKNNIDRDALQVQSEIYNNGFIILPKRMQIQEPSADTNTVRYIIDFRCPFCRSAHDFIKVWSKNLPSDYEFIYEVALTGNEGDEVVALATRFVLDSDLPLEKKELYLTHMYTHLAKTRNPKEVGRLVKEATKDVGIEYDDLMAYLLDDSSRLLLKAQHENHVKARIQNTPSVLVGGKLYTHFGLAKADPKKWIMILNAIVSKHIYMERDPDLFPSKEP